MAIWLWDEGMEFGAWARGGALGDFLSEHGKMGVDRWNSRSVAWRDGTPLSNFFICNFCFEEPLGAGGCGAWADWEFSWACFAGGYDHFKRWAWLCGRRWICNGRGRIFVVATFVGSRWERRFEAWALDSIWLAGRQRASRRWIFAERAVGDIALRPDDGG